MASINKLSIRGVRAFSPDEKEQVIEFFYPVTVIVGANGCGKTTIIESLKYAVTGSLPPGNKAGQAFVHDPKSVGQSVVKANIKLRFTNRLGNTMVVSRSMEVQQKKTTLSFKALDGVLRSNNPETGERISMSHKCTELDRQIPSIMGVTKPVLEHVMFCHQEDSSWPLMEGAVLQKRFDDIFDSTKYAKALVAIRATSKDYAAKAKDLKADVEGLRSHQHAAKLCRQELEQHNEQVEEIEEEIVTIKEELNGLDDEIRRADDVLSRIGTAVDDLEVKQNELERERTKANTQLEMLQENLTEKHTLRELKDMLSDFDEQVADQEQQKQDLERNIQSLQNKIQSYRQEEMQLQGQLGKLEAEKEAHEKVLRSRLSKMEQMAHTYSINLAVTQTQGTMLTGTQESQDDTTTAGGGTQGSIISISPEDMQAFTRALEQKERELTDELKQFREKSQAAEDQLQVVLGDAIGKEKSIENDRKKIAQQRQEARQEIDTLARETHRGPRMRKSEIEESKRDLIRIAQEREALNKEQKESDAQVKIRNIESKSEELKREIEDDELVLKELRDNAEAQQQIVMLEEQAAKELEDLQETLTLEESSFRQYNIDSPMSLPGLKGDGNEDELVGAMHEWANKVEDKYNDMKTDLDRAQEKETAKQKSVSESSALLEHNRRSMQKLQGRMTALDGSMREFRQMVRNMQAFEVEHGDNVAVPEGVSPQDLLDTLTNLIDDLSSYEVPKMAFSKIMKRLYRLREVRDDDGSKSYVCPCCERDMDSDEIQVMQTAMQKLMDVETSPLMKPLNADRAETNRVRTDKYQDMKSALEPLMKDLHEHERVHEEIATLKADIAKLEEELQRNQVALDKAKDSSSDIEKEANDLRSLVEKTKRWCEEASRISEKRLQITSKHETSMSMSMVIPDTGGRDLKQVERDLQDKRNRKDEMASRVQRLNKDMTLLNNKISANSIKAEKIQQILKEKEERYAKEQETQIRRTELTDKLEALEAEDKELEEQLAPIRLKIREKEAKRQRARSQASEEENQLSKSVTLFRNDVDALSALTSQIDRYEDSHRGEDGFNRLASKITRLNDNVQSREKELQTLSPKLDALTKSVGDQQRHKKNIEDNISQISFTQSIAALEQEIAELEKEVQNIEGSATAEQDAHRARKRKTELLNAKARHEGRRGGIVDNVRALKRKLQTPEYKDVDERYRVTMIKHQTTVIAVADLDKYYTAVDKALMRFHNIKIGEINKIIRDLWSMTYKGQDITNIELIAGQDTGSRAKRSYNYRVVMTKGNAKLDMRGRCSAGQRVLACIVIRLALAETFCLNCGVIALDEPTVNLDFDNKKGLAVALAQIIALRSRQENFQLVTITHDQEFVHMIKSELATQSGFDMPDRYFQVRREEGRDGKYYSKINAIDWDEL